MRIRGARRLAASAALAAAAVPGGAGWGTGTALAAQQPTAAPTAAPAAVRSLVLVVYEGAGAAKRAFDGMRTSKSDQVIRVDAYGVVSRDSTGTIRVEDQRRGLTPAGEVITAAVRLTGGRMPIDTSAAADVGADRVPRDLQDDLRSALVAPRSSVVVAVVRESSLDAFRRRMRELGARRIVDEPLARP